MVHDLGSWGPDGSLEDRWWSRTPPTAVLKAVNYDAQMFAVMMVQNLLYDWREGYVFGASLPDGTFHTGPYVVGPVDWIKNIVHRRRPTFLIGVCVKDDQWGLFEKYADF